MKKKVLFLALTMLSLLVNAQTKVWTNDPQHSRLGFVVKHLMISQINGRFADFKAVVTTTKADYSDAKIVLTAKVSSIDTDVEARDNHLRSADFFDAEKFPTLTFVSTSIKKVGPKKGVMYGKLTFHGITKDVKLNVVFFGMLTNPMNNKTTAGFQVTGVVKRTDYDLGPKFPNAMVSNDINIVANVEFSPDK
ncbi:MAG: polyisoprenoid-binding protein [Bacteroidales bacterium]|jgi:polyisoprenoid-binding protein YceI|nr:polyisoprenoid-binding protein [Bacteroidales bacterium]